MRRRRHPSDPTDAEWALLEPLLPVPACETTVGGRPEKHHRPEIVAAFRYVAGTSCKWRALPADYPLWRTVWGVHGPLGRLRHRRPYPRWLRR
ncbi:hypothetical protein GCM10010302_32390 [Streptomyces polychromogenes]|uniref:Insertion element IS402-like domain-containing protein n=1 Tax=Streptomyces polychromogenes TaxID=67342 RepID=A0ABP3F3F6_9ACTN